MSTNDDLKWPAGYCLDPNGKMSIPEGQAEAWNFGYEIGFREAMSIKMRAVARAAVAADISSGSQAAEIAALRADAQRLDFLHSHPTAITRSFGYRGAPDLWTSRGDYSTSRQSQDFASLRDAIDAAVAAHAAQG